MSAKAKEITIARRNTRRDKFGELQRGKRVQRSKR